MTTSWHLVASLVIKIFDIVKIVVVTSVIIVTHHFNFVMVLDHIAMHGHRSSHYAGHLERAF